MPVPLKMDQSMLSIYGKNEWLAVTLIGLMLIVTLLIVGWWPAAIVVLLATAAVLSFFRDPHRRVPTQRGVVCAPSDGKVSSIHHVDMFEPFGEGATCVRIFMSVFVAHVNRSPCHGIVDSITHKPGDHRNTLNPDSAEANESNLIVLKHPMRRHPVAAVRQIAGLLARTIVCGVRPEQILQRGQRIGMIKLGSTTELYLPDSQQPQVMVTVGQKVKAGTSVIAQVATPSPGKDPAASSQPSQNSATPAGVSQSA